MGIIEQLLKEIESSELDEQVIELCDKIMKEEQLNTKYSEYIPQGANIFLSLEVPEISKNKISFLSLEREYKEKYIISLWTGFSENLVIGNEKVKRIQTWNIDKFDSAPKILREYAKVMKYLKGE